MRKFAVLAVAAAALAFVAPTKAQAQIVITSGSTPYYGGYSSGYSPFGYSSGYSPYRYSTGNFGIVQSGYGNFGSYYPSYYGGLGNGYRGFNSSSYYRSNSFGNYRGNGFGNYRGYSRGGFGGRRR
ncbi:hypothetical protein GobsT_34730 [Gemmata obscuriglobus]|uniref:Uncharacterized protein n=1 Tax=Gemmata obscuriglobus TaxID=114 RepID=A0A2Z3GX99_9BACT|nr:hypothetical protein [Gemmata obscuriglobus]AWM38393.1 hypothetical protein C1280_16275 [Gemmata obscuriglobus]QEG28687.1 hypothetical protein GobsT_34730 [Gemmata obscuriglobus]VTS06938.1 unnamed protein product [Gemmata obscuriglobus UQM 2246]